MEIPLLYNNCINENENDNRLADIRLQRDNVNGYRSYMTNYIEFPRDIKIEDTNKGYIYCVYNKIYNIYGKHVYKIGKTKNINIKMRSYASNYIDSSELVLKIKVSNIDYAEKILLYKLEKYRMRKNRKFVNVKLEIIKNIFMEIIGLDHDKKLTANRPHGADSSLQRANVDIYIDVDKEDDEDNDDEEDEEDEKDEEDEEDEEDDEDEVDDEKDKKNNGWWSKWFN